MRYFLTFIAIITLFATACTPEEIQDYWDKVGDGTELEPEVLDFLVEESNRDCLPGYDSDIYVECAIRDAWERFSVDQKMSLERWAALAWCESRHDPEAQNRRSTASGLYQFLDSTWVGVMEQSNLGYGTSRQDQYHARQNAMAAAWYMMAAGPSRWVCA